jgi:uncharacterized protein YjbJ (UPF0337 family)
MNEDRIEGAVANGLGRVEDAVGGLTGDGRTQMRGKLRQAAGRAQSAYGQVKDQAQDVLHEVRGVAGDLVDQGRERSEALYEDLADIVAERPLQSLLIGLGVGVVLGLLMRPSKTVYVNRRD